MTEALWTENELTRVLGPPSQALAGPVGGLDGELTIGTCKLKRELGLCVAVGAPHALVVDLGNRLSALCRPLVHGVGRRGAHLRAEPHAR